ncbi:MAG: AraC family transcriptional regulator [Hyphomicrobiaceae bacterium]
MQTAHNSAFLNVPDHFKIVASFVADLEGFLGRRYGLDLKPLAGEVGLCTKDFQRSDMRISLDRVCRLLNLVAARTGDQDLGLAFASVTSLGNTGFFGYGQSSAPTLGAMLNFKLKFLSLVCDLSDLRLEKDKNRCYIHWSLPSVLIEKSQFSLIAMGMLVRLVRENIDDQWSPLEVQFDFPMNGASQALKESVCGLVQFGQSANIVILPPGCLELPNRNRDDRLYQLVLANLDEQLVKKQQATSMLDAVIAEIGYSVTDPDLSLSRTASRLATSERTLQRYLSSQQLSFSDLRDQARRELSDNLLRSSNVRIYEVAERMGFSTNSAYTRSARRWYGVPPSMRRRHLMRSSS